MSELQKISDNDEQMKRLCAAVTVQGDKKESGQLSFRAVQSALHQRLQEFRAFDQHRSCLSHLCNHLSDAIQGNEFNEDIVIRSHVVFYFALSTHRPPPAETGAPEEL